MFEYDFVFCWRINRNKYKILHLTLFRWDGHCIRCVGNFEIYYGHLFSIRKQRIMVEWEIGHSFINFNGKLDSLFFNMVLEYGVLYSNPYRHLSSKKLFLSLSCTVKFCEKKLRLLVKGWVWGYNEYKVIHDHVSLIFLDQITIMTCCIYWLFCLHTNLTLV